MQKLEADKGVTFAYAIEEEKPTTGGDAFVGQVTLADLQLRQAA
jgi:hypothetical protein